MLWSKKNSYKEFDNETEFPRLENSPPPTHNFSWSVSNLTENGVHVNYRCFYFDITLSRLLLGTPLSKASAGSITQ